ncbi:MAG TPA: tRNA dihydrouridine synthase DusB [Myxococcota bacterium]|nr:tRNA dihydrouridine synthase DusB [Myxococcota bacterium]
MRVRDVVVDPPLALAPMEGVTDLSFRRLVRRVGGAGLVFTEFIPARGLARQEARWRKLAVFDDDERPIAIQVYGREPDVLAEGARVAEALGADIVDLNMGCPSKKVCAHSGGSALLQTPDLARDIVRAIRAAVRCPFTVKMRAGWDATHRNAPEIAYMCQEEGVEAVTVHWRTRTDGYGGVLDLSTVAEVKRRLRIPVICNGDVVDAASARRALDETGCDGLMIGRGAVKNPWVFREIGHALYGGPPVVVDATERERVLLGYFREIRERFGSDAGALGRWKKISRYFTEGVARGELLRDGILHAASVDEVLDVVPAFFDRLRAWETGDEGAFSAWREARAPA